MKRLLQYTKEYFRSLGELFFFSKHPGVGIGLCVLVAVFAPFAFACTLLGSALGQAHAIRYSTPKAVLTSGLLPVNGFFFGLAMAHLFQPSPAFYVCLLTGALLLPVVTKALFEILQHWKLSPLITPYIVCTWALWLAKNRLGLEVMSRPRPKLLEVAHSQIISEPFLSAGRLLFLPEVGFGLLLLALIFVFSPRRGFFFVLGTLVACGAAYVLSGPSSGLSFGALTYSGGLTALALASLRQRFKIHNIAFFAGLSTLVTLACEEFFARQNLPVLTIPTVLTIWLAQLSRVPRVSVSWAPANIHRRQNLHDSDPIFTGGRAV